MYGSLHDGRLGVPSRPSGSGLVGGGLPAATPPSQSRWCEETRKTIREDVLNAREMPHGEIVPEQLVVPGLHHEVELWLSVQVHESLVVGVQVEVTPIDEMVEAREGVDNGQQFSLGGRVVALGRRQGARLKRDVAMRTSLRVVLIENST
jgi:hypothetical protein